MRRSVLSAVNDELIAVCAPENFDEWTKFKMEKTLQKAKNDSATATIRKLAAVQGLEEAAARYVSGTPVACIVLVDKT